MGYVVMPKKFVWLRLQKKYYLPMLLIFITVPSVIANNHISSDNDKHKKKRMTAF